MVLYVNNNNEVKDVNTTSDNSLTPLTVNDENNPFIGWSVAKICCFKVKVTDGTIAMFTPYVDSKIIEHIDRLSSQNISTQAQIDYIAMMSDIDV